MLGHRYYHETTRRYVAVFGTLFNDIVIDRKSNSGDVVQQMKVPISYGPRQKFLAKLEGDPNLDRPSAITLPRMSFEITGMTYDGSRKLQQINRHNKADSGQPNNVDTQFHPSPYNVDFSLTIMTKYAEDGTKILEQILPFFQPAWNSTMRIVDEMEETVDIPLVLNGVETEDAYEGDFITRRALMWTMTFTLKGYYYGPITKKKIIKFSKTDVYSTMEATRNLTSVIVKPGMNVGIQARGLAVVDGGGVSEVEVTSGGAGYLNPTVTISAPDVFGTPATARPVVNPDGVIISIDVLESGSGYTDSPKVTIDEPDNGDVPYEEIDFDDPWDYVVTFEDAENG